VTLDRRAFFGLVGGATLAWPRRLEGLARALEDVAQDEDAYWALVRREFLIPEGRIYLNNGTLGPSPRVVVDAVSEHTRRVAQTLPPGVAWDDLKGALANLLGGDADGFVFPRNTTEAMSFVAHGVELGPDDEVVSTDHEHIGGVEPWKLVTTRRGASLTIASLPVPATSSEQLADAVWAAVSPRTRIVCVSHVTFTTGTVLPIAELARRCDEAGIVLAVDGAHPPGMLDVDLAEVSGDFYASSPHKWLLAPQGSGLLYLTEPWRERLWPTIGSGGWDDLSLGAHRFNHMGTVDESRLAGLLAAVDFLRVIGMERVAARVRALRGTLDRELRAIPGVEVVTPADEALAAGMVSFEVDGVESAALQRHLSEVANVRTRVIGEYDYGWMRLSTHVYNTHAELTRVLELISEAARRGVPA
jgi:isopenicillin-N epimerase